MRIVFVHSFFYPDISSASQILSDLAFALAREDGYEIHVFTSRLLYDDPASILPAFELIRGVKVHRVWTSRFGRKNLFGRLLNYLTFYPPVFFGMLWFFRRGDVGVAKTNPPLLCVPVWLAAWPRGALLVNWLQDIFPEAAAALGIKAAQGLAGRGLAWLRDQTLKFAAMNVVVGQRMANVIRGRGIADDRIMLIPNWADGDAIRPLRAEANPLRKEWGLSDKFVAGYSGNLGRAHDVDTILGAAEYLRNDSRLVFLIVGGGHGYALLQTKVVQRQLTNIVFKPYQPLELLGVTLAVPDVHLVSLLPELEGLIFPSKVYGAMAAGRPVAFIGATNGELAEQIDRYSCGTSIAPGDSVGLADFLMRLCRDPGLKDQMGRNGRAAFDANFDRPHALTKWRNLLEHVAPAREAHRCSRRSKSVK